MEEPYISQLASALAVIIVLIAMVYFYILYKRNAGLYFKPMEPNEKRGYLHKALKSIFPVVKPDPLKHCAIYKKEGCAHVDGPLCDVEHCNPEFKGSNVIHIKKE